MTNGILYFASLSLSFESKTKYMYSEADKLTY